MKKLKVKNNVPFPELIIKLSQLDGDLNTFELATTSCRVLFAYYPAGKVIHPHSHLSENFGIVIGGELILEKDGVERKYPVGSWYHLDFYQVHAARFDRNTEIIEFWFESGTKRIAKKNPFKF